MFWKQQCQKSFKTNKTLYTMIFLTLKTTNIPFNIPLNKCLSWSFWQKLFDIQLPNPWAFNKLQKTQKPTTLWACSSGKLLSAINPFFKTNHLIHINFDNQVYQIAVMMHKYFVNMLLCGTNKHNTLKVNKLF